MKKRWTFFIEDQSACLLNNAYVKDGRSTQRRKSNDTQQWLHTLNAKMRVHKKSIQEIKEFFDPMKHFATCEYIWFIPGDKFFCKGGKNKGKINERCGDTSNFAKVPDDLVFNVIFAFDDSFICRETVYKLPYRGTKNHIKITVEIRESSELWLKAIQELPLHIQKDL